MTFVPGEFIYRATFDMALYADPVSITLWIKDTLEQTTDQSQGIATVLDGWFETNVMTDLTGDLFYQGLTVYNMESETAPKGVIVKSPSVPGSILEDPTPTQAAAITTFETANRGRSGRGRVYLPGIPETDVSDGQISPAAQTKFETIWPTLTGVLTGANLQHVVASRISNGVPRTALLAQPVTAYIVRRYVGTQRRRTRGL